VFQYSLPILKIYSARYVYYRFSILAEISKRNFRLNKGVATILALKLLLRSKYVNLFHTYTYTNFIVHQSWFLSLACAVSRASRINGPRRMPMLRLLFSRLRKGIRTISLNGIGTQFNK